MKEKNFAPTAKKTQLVRSARLILGSPAYQSVKLDGMVARSLR